MILHSALAIEPSEGQPLGLLWQKLWNRPTQASPPVGETPEEKKQRKAKAKKEARSRPFSEKESYKWVEALDVVDKQVEGNTRVIQVFDRSGDIAEVFDRVRELKHTGVLVRTTYNRSLDPTGEHLWQTMESEPIAFTREIEVPAAVGRKARARDTSSTFPSD